MKGFIEVIYQDQKALININQIAYLRDEGDGTTLVHLTPYRDKDHLRLTIKSDYATIVQAIEWAAQ